MLTKALGYSVTCLLLKSHHFPVVSGISHSSLLGTAAMNTFLPAALCLLGAWAALAAGVTVQVSLVPTLVQMALCPQCPGSMSW